MMHTRIIIMIFFPIFAIAQAPQKINFQSILRNSSGELIGNKSVSLKISILSGSINGSSVYSETHVKTTDASGLISLQIGNGTVISGIFVNIDWGGASHFIKLEADFNGGSNYVVLGTQELMSVPYAMYASKTDTSVLNLASRLATKLNVTDTVSLSNRINANANSGSSDTSLLNLTTRLATKLNVTDTTSLSNRIDGKLTKTDTASLSNRIDGKLTKTDTASLSNRIDAKLTKTDTAYLSNRIDDKLTKTDTASLSNRIDDKLTKTDTASLSNRIDDKLTKTDTASLSNRINLKLTKTDTASLSNRIDDKLTKTDTASLSNRIDDKLTKTDTASLSNRIDGKLTKTDTASLSNRIDAKLSKPESPVNGDILFYNNNNWSRLPIGQEGQVLTVISGIPSWSSSATGSPPTGVSAISGNSSASVSFVAPANNGGTTISGYVVTSNPGGITVTGTTSPINVTGLTNGTAYTFTVGAVGVASAASTAVTPVTVSGTPTGVVATAGNSSASVAFVAPTNNGGSAITGYTVTSNPGNISVSGTTSPINVTGLTNGTAYTFSVVAANSVGSSLASSASTVVTPNVCPTSTITDIDGNTYNTVIIDSQCWMSENLKTSRYRNGVSIPIVTDATAWGSLTTGGRSWYNNDSTAYENPYGNLYNWYAVVDSGGLCPTGWGVPTDAEWTTLTDNNLGGLNEAGGKMKSTGTTYWSYQSTATNNSSGFSALPGGYRNLDGSFTNIRDNALFWSDTENENNTAWTRYLFNYFDFMSRNNTYNKSFGASVRCLRD